MRKALIIANLLFVSSTVFGMFDAAFSRSSSPSSCIVQRSDIPSNYENAVRTEKQIIMSKESQKSSLKKLNLSYLGFRGEDMRRKDKSFSCTSEEAYKLLNCADELGNTILHTIASDPKDYELGIRVVRALKRNPTFNWNQKNKEGASALSLAIKNRNYPLVKAFLQVPDVDRNALSDTDRNTLKDRDINVDFFSDEYLLFKACKAKDKVSIHSLLRKGTDVSKSGVFGKTIWSIDPSIKKLVLELCKDIDFKNEDGETPLFDACRQGEAGLVKYLVGRGANVNHQNNIGGTPLSLACEGGNLEVVKYLIEEKDVNINQVDIHENIPLLYACKKGRLDVVKYLVKRGANVNHQNNIGETPLLLACEDGNLDVVKYLIEEKDVNINQVDNYGNNPLSYACKRGRLDVVKYLVDNGVDVNKAGSTGWTPLFAACVGGHLEVVKYLIENGANINQSDKWGKTPLFVACEKGNKATVKYLIEHGADVNQSDNTGQTPLSVAKTEEIKNLLRVQIPLVMACANENKATVKYLIEHGANVNQSDKDGWTPLHMACLRRGSKASEAAAIVELLIEHGANVNQSNKHDLTPLRVSKNVSIRALLEEHGATE